MSLSAALYRCTVLSHFSVWPCYIYHVDTTQITTQQNLSLKNQIDFTSQSQSIIDWNLHEQLMTSELATGSPCPGLAWPGLAHSDMAASSFNLPSSDIRIVCWALNLPKGWAGVDRRGSAVCFTLASGPESGRLRICDATDQFARIQYRIEFNDSLALTLGVLWNLFISLRQPRFDLSAQRSTTRNNFQSCCHFADAGSHDGSLLGLVLPVCLCKNNHPILSCLPFLKKNNYSCFWYVYLFIWSSFLERYQINKQNNTQYIIISVFLWLFWDAIFIPLHVSTVASRK